MKPIFYSSVSRGIRICRVEISGGEGTTPEEFAVAAKEVVTEFPGTLPLIFDGEIPAWGTAMLVHLAHPTPWVALRIPQHSVAVVVASYSSERRIGQKILFPPRS